MQFFVWLVRFAAAACLALIFGEWRPAWDSPNSRSGYFLLLVAVAVYVWLVVFPKKWQEEAIGLVAGGYLI